MKTKDSIIQEYSKETLVFFSRTERKHISELMESYANQKVAEERERIEKWLDSRKIMSNFRYDLPTIEKVIEFLSQQPEAERVQEDKPYALDNPNYIE